MPYKMIGKNTWLAQVQRGGLRATKRGKGGEAAAKKAEAALVADLERRLRRQEAALVLGLDPSETESATSTSDSATLPTLAEYLTTRWASHARLVQNETTLRTTRSHVKYLAYYLGDRPLDQLTVADVNKMIEAMHATGPLSFKLRQDGRPVQRRSSAFTPTAINRILGTLKAALNLAKSEGVVESPPQVKLLPMDHSRPIVPPNDTEFEAIVEASRGFADVAPHFPEVIEIAAGTGLRLSELFNLRWRSVDFSLGATGGLRVEEQQRSRLVGGKPWKPKHLKFRVVPLTPTVRAVLEGLRRRVPSAPDDLVIPNRGGCPYVRIEHAPDCAGMGMWYHVLDACGLKGKVRFHDLRHRFAVSCLQRGIPIAAVSCWLGHSDVNLTVKRYGRWSSEAREQWKWIKNLEKPVDALAKGATIAIKADSTPQVIDGP